MCPLCVVSREPLTQTRRSTNGQVTHHVLPVGGGLPSVCRSANPLSHSSFHPAVPKYLCRRYGTRSRWHCQHASCPSLVQAAQMDEPHSLKCWGQRSDVGVPHDSQCGSSSKGCPVLPSVSVQQYTDQAARSHGSARRLSIVISCGRATGRNSAIDRTRECSRFLKNCSHRLAIPIKRVRSLLYVAPSQNDVPA